MDALPPSLTSLSLSANPLGPKGAEALSSAMEVLSSSSLSLGLFGPTSLVSSVFFLLLSTCC